MMHKLAVTVVVHIYLQHFCFHIYLLRVLQVFKTYYEEDSVIPQDDQEKRDEWVRRWSHAVGYNLCPLWEFYSLPLSESMCRNLTYTPLLFNDIVTQKQ